MAQHPAIPFSVEAEAADMSVHGGLPLHFAAGRLEADWVSGRDRAPGLAPFLGHTTYEDARPGAHSLPFGALVLHAVGTQGFRGRPRVSSMMRAGYPWAIVLRAWGRHSCDHLEAAVERLTCRHVASHPARRRLPSGPPLAAATL